MSRDNQSHKTDSSPSLGDQSRSTEQPALGSEQPFDADEDLDLHHHTALLYEQPTDQFAAVLPFIRDGLERGDRCLYIYNDNSKTDVVAAMHDAGIDVEAAVAAGDLSFHSKEEPFLQNGSFVPDATIDFASETIRAATEDDGYNAVLVTGEMSWILEGEHNLDRMIEYEQALNTVFGTRPVHGICQYNVEKFDPEILNQIIRTHPNLVYGGSVGQDFYYMPFEGALGTDNSDANSELRQTLLERVTAYERLESREQALSALNDATRELMQLEADALPDRAVDLARVLDVAFASIWSYDETSGELEQQSHSTDYEHITALAEHYQDHAWDVFVTKQTKVYEELSGDRSESSPTELRSGVIVPLGRHGVFCAGSIHPDAFDDSTIELAKTIGANIEAAFDRAEREQMVEEKNRQLERLNRINRVIREISETLVEADTREDIEQIVCEQLAASDPYQFAWIGSEDVETETITPQAWAGVSKEYFEDCTVSTRDGEPTGQGPVSTALRTRTVQTVQDTVIDPSIEPWRETIHQHGFSACISIPLTHAELSYGVLTLYADTPNVFDEMEEEVLTELGEMIAHSIDAAETKELLRAPSVVELTFTVSDPTDILARLAHAIDDEIHFDGLVDHSGDSTELFFTVQDSTANDVISEAKALCGISETQVIRDGDKARVFTVTVTEPTLASRIIDNQAIICSLTATEQEMTVVVDLPSTTAVREFLDTLKSTYPNLGFMSRQNNDRPIKRGQGLQEVVAEQLTDRQREVLKTAYLSGFFQSPRARTGAELAEALDISQSTFTHHLRGAERRFFEMVFDND